MAYLPYLDGVQENASHSLFTLMWTNEDVNSNTNDMTHYKVKLRTWNQPWGLSCKKLHLDQVHIIFRPTSDIPTNIFVTGDDATKTWRAETSQLYVRTNPGNEFPVFHQDMGKRPLTYSQALTLTPDVDGSEDYWCRTYRPLRDTPIWQGLNACTEIDIQLMFPILSQDSRSTLEQIPSYRILKVICHFSAEL